jgi:KaiC/GvpD/RAD55 family RecA-like ATPase
MRQSAALYWNPSLAELRDAVLKIANQFRVEFTPVTEHGRFCTLMVDTATSWPRTWLGLCISTPRGFSFWRCTSIADQTTATLIERLLEICRNLMRKRFVVCRIVTDNATDEIVAVRDLPK